MAKEIGYKNWARFAKLDFQAYPEIGHPFADYWGIWVKTECAVPDDPERSQPRCLEMGGCSDGRPYPPPRQTPVNKARGDLDPSLAYDVSEFGHLGYNPKLGPPNAEQAIQAQYRGSWDLWMPPNDNPALADFLADKVIEFVQEPRPQKNPGAVYLGIQGNASAQATTR